MAEDLVYVEALSCGYDSISPSYLLSVERRGQYSRVGKVLRRAPPELTDVMNRLRCGGSLSS